MPAPAPAAPESGIQVLAVVITLPGSPSVNYYLSTHGFTTAADDSPPNTFFDGRIQNEPSYRRAVSCVYWGSRKSESGIGALDIINADGQFDALSATNIRNSSVLMYRGTLGTNFETWTHVATAIVDTMELNGEETARIVLFDKSSLLERPLQTALYSDGENVSLKGRPIPISYGMNYSCPAPQASTTQLIYDVNDRVFQSISLVRDSGVILSGPGSSPTGWEYDVDVGFHGFQLARNPFKQIVADVDGSIDAIGSPTTTVNRLPEVMSFLTVTHGPLLITDMHTSSMNTLDLYDLADWIDSAQSISDTLDDVMQSFGGWWYFDRLGLLRVGRLGSTADPVLRFTETELIGEISVVLDKATGVSDIVLAQRNNFVHTASDLATEGDLAGSVSEEDKAMLSANFRQKKQSTNPLASAYTQGAQGGYLPSETARGRPAVGGIETLISDATHAQTQADYVGDLFGTAKYFWTFSAAMSLTDMLALEPGDKVELYLGGQTLPERYPSAVYRFGLGQPKEVELVSIEYSFVSNIVRFIAHGGAPVEEAYTLELDDGGSLELDDGGLLELEDV